MRQLKYSSQRVKLRWRKDEPVIMNPELRMLQFEVELSRNFVVNRSTRDFGGYSDRHVFALVMEFKFYRLLGHHIVQTYIPSFLMVSLTWFSFWIGLDAIPGRVTLLVTSLLTIVTLFSGINRDIPAVAYIKAIDIWMAGCIFFAFAAMGEFVICKVIKVFHEKHRIKPITDGSRPRSYPISRHSSVGGSPMFINNNHQSNNNNFKQEPALNSHYTSQTGLLTHRSNQPWPPPGDVERGLRADASSNRITKINGREIDLGRNISVVGAANPSFLSNGDNKRSRDMDLRSTSSSSDWDQMMVESRDKRRKKWIKTIRDLEMQWDDPETGDTKILWEEIDSTSRVLFPCVFFIFAAIYFPLLILL
ncbi:Neurotransmitter-gated ion-channel transmembrane domain [Trinorchestia longiramus]|nr:Neurotransmitter-gated ion-channel transmembrane domain [Trinorchestia longiramus]